MLPKAFCLLLVVCVSPLAFTADLAVAQDRLPRILLGEETDEFPAVGIVGSVRSGGFCTGTLISPSHVLTAAHCAEVIQSRTSGTFELGGQVYGTADILIHPDYNFFTLANDLAVLQLNEPVLDVEPSQIYRDAPLVGDLLSIVGFRATGSADGGSDGTFGTKRVGVTTIDEVTSDLVSWTFDDESESNTAAGDSGGPGYIDIDGDLFVACVTSGGTEPDSVLGDFAFNTRVDAFADWIDLTIALADQPPSPEPASPEPTDPEGSADDGFWSQPFPFLQFVIEFLTQLLEFLTDSIGDQGVEAVETPVEAPVEAPAEIPAETDQPTTETPAPETTTDNPADCPPATPTDPVDTSSGEETTTDPIAEPATDPTEVAPANEEVTLPIVSAPPIGGGAPVGGITQPGGSAPIDITSASILASWQRAAQLRARSLARTNHERLIFADTDIED